jgi:hypothetical protein
MNANVTATTMVPADAGATCAIAWKVLVWEHEIRRHGRVPRGSCCHVLGSQVTHTLTHPHSRTQASWGGEKSVRERQTSTATAHLNDLVMHLNILSCSMYNSAFSTTQHIPMVHLPVRMNEGKNSELSVQDMAGLRYIACYKMWKLCFYECKNVIACTI